MDLKIAATTLVHGALLLSANLRDFQQVPLAEFAVIHKCLETPSALRGR